MNQSLQALSFLENFPLVEAFVGTWLNLEQSSCIYLPSMMKTWLQELKANHGTTLSKHAPAERKRNLCESIWENTQTPIPVDDNITVSEWSTRVTGSGLRWEVLGLIAVTFGMSVLSPNASYPSLVDNGIKQDEMVANIMTISESCLSLCRASNAVGDLFAWLLYEHARLVRCAGSERSFTAYSAIGEASSAVLAMGLHQGPGLRAPFFILELRKRLLVSIYAMEVSTATFLGRPTRLSAAYCNLEPPLTLTDEELMLRGPELDALLCRLDQQPSQLDARSDKITWLRAWVILGPRREEILDLALGRYTQEDLIRRAEMIEEKIQNEQALLPSLVRNRTIDEPDNTKLSPLAAIWRVIIRADAHTNDLLLQRLLIRKATTTPEKLIRAAQAILSDVQHVTRRYLTPFTHEADFVWLLLLYGLRSAAILAVELLKQEEGYYSFMNSTQPLLPRSRTIQDLAVFASTLISVNEENPAYNACEQGHRAITRMLDKILAPKELGTDTNHRQQRLPITPDEREFGSTQTQVTTNDQQNGRPCPVTTAAEIPSGSISGPDTSITNMDFLIGAHEPFCLQLDESLEDWLDYVNQGNLMSGVMS